MRPCCRTRCHENAREKEETCPHEKATAVEPAVVEPATGKPSEGFPDPSPPYRCSEKQHPCHRCGNCVLCPHRPVGLLRQLNRLIVVNTHAGEVSIFTTASWAWDGMPAGTDIVLKGTVRTHGDFNDTPTTRIARAKLLARTAVTEDDDGEWPGTLIRRCSPTVPQCDMMRVRTGAESTAKRAARMYCDQNFFPTRWNSVVEQGRYSLNSVDDLYVL